jgi:hypothetical protein
MPLLHRRLVTDERNVGWDAPPNTLFEHRYETTPKINAA